MRTPHMKRMIALAPVFCFLALISTGDICAQTTPPPGQTGGGVDKQTADIRKDQALEEKITKEKPKEEGLVLEKAVPVEEGQKTLIKTIDVKGATLIPQKTITRIISEYEEREINLREMQKVCDLITDEYRKKGYVTSRAYLPPQTIKDGLLNIIVVEGKLGNVEVKGNRYFRSDLLKKKLELRPGRHFDYKKLQRSLTKINEHPDRFVKSILVPGKEPGTTDIVLEVQDRLPVHAGYEYDNFGSRYINYDRHTVSAEHNNLIGFDDKFSFKYQKGQNQFYEMTSLRYTIPLVATLEAGAYWLWSTVRLGKEYKASHVKGTSEIGGLFFNYLIIDLPTVDLRLNGGFDYKHISNYMEAIKTSRDEVRMFKLGFDLDMYDRWGRTIIALEEDVGVPFGNLHGKDDSGTRVGAGSEFWKLAGSIYRLQPMPFESAILMKNQFQLSHHYRLLAVEQFQVGGIANVRGFSPAEYTGDSGWATSVEWSFPPYFFPRNIKVPLSKATFYDAIRFLAFYDFGFVHMVSYTTDEKENRVIQGWGGGLRVNLPEDFFARLEFAYRFQSDIAFDDANMYIDVGKKF